MFWCSSGAPQRVNGKVSGSVSVGLTAVGLDKIDLHAYIVVGDGRAYTAISEVPEPLGWALMPVAPIGGLFGWLFALKLPDSHNGFNTTGECFYPVLCLFNRRPPAGTHLRAGPLILSLI